MSNKTSTQIRAADYGLPMYFDMQAKMGHTKHLGGADATLVLRSSMFDNATIHSGSEPTEVRAIVHKPRQLNLTMRQDDQIWQINSSGPWAGLSKIKVKNKTNSIGRQIKK